MAQNAVIAATCCAKVLVIIQLPLAAFLDPGCECLDNKGDEQLPSVRLEDVPPQLRGAIVEITEPQCLRRFSGNYASKKGVSGWAELRT